MNLRLIVWTDGIARYAGFHGFDDLTRKLRCASAVTAKGNGTRIVSRSRICVGSRDCNGIFIKEANLARLSCVIMETRRFKVKN